MCVAGRLAAGLQRNRFAKGRFVFARFASCKERESQRIADFDALRVQLGGGFILFDGGFVFFGCFERDAQKPFGARASSGSNLAARRVEAAQ